MNQIQAFKGDFHGEQAVYLQAGRYEAIVLPQLGGNCIAFRDHDTGCRFLREPLANEMEAFKRLKYVYGIPVLIPPNRFEDGKFPWNGKTYRLPVNEEWSGNHLHGFVSDAPWEAEDYGQTSRESFVTISLTVDERHPVYRHLPHKCTIRLRYGLDESGLSQQLFIRNEGSDRMPCLAGFHTTINAPFAPGGSAKDYRVKLTIGERWEMNGRMLPTGRRQPLTQEEEQLKREGVNPFFAALDHHYTAVPQNGRNRMELTDTRLGTTLVYDVGTSWKQWMLWNNGAEEGFFCPEPQTSLVNAPNVDKPADEIGLFGLEPGEIWEAHARLYIKG